MVLTQHKRCNTILSNSLRNERIHLQYSSFRENWTCKLVVIFGWKTPAFILLVKFVNLVKIVVFKSVLQAFIERPGACSCVKLIAMAEYQTWYRVTCQTHNCLPEGLNS